MVDMVTWAANHGIAIFYLTGRPSSQESATLGNLTDDGVGVDAGYPDPTQLPDGEDGLFTKPAVTDYPTTCGRVRRRPRRQVHDHPLQGRDPRAHRVARATTSSRTSATSTATSRAATPTAPSSCPNPNYFLP